MNYKIINKETKVEVNLLQKDVFLKLLAAHGPKRQCKNWAIKTLKAYPKAQKDFYDIFGFMPEAVYGGENANRR